MKYFSTVLLALLLGVACEGSGTLVIDDGSGNAGDDDDAVGDDDDSVEPPPFDGAYGGDLYLVSEGWDGDEWDLCTGEFGFDVIESVLTGAGLCELDWGDGGGGGDRQVTFIFTGDVDDDGKIDGIVDIDLSEVDQAPQQCSLSGGIDDDGAKIEFTMTFSFGGGGNGGGGFDVDGVGTALLQ